MHTVIRLSLAIALLAAGPASAQNKEKVYRWVDENGDVHYSESLPPDFQDRQHDVLDSQGITRETGQSLTPPPPKPADKKSKGELPTDASGLKRPEPLYSPEELQARQDALLLLRYDSEKEIQDAMEVEINQLSYDRRLLTTSRSSMEEAWRGNVREAADRQRAGLEVAEEKARELRVLRRRLDNNATSLAAIDKREASIRAVFERELERYRNLIREAEAQADAEADAGGTGEQG